MTKLLLLLLMIPLFATASATFTIWKAQELKSMAKSETLGDFDNYNVRLTVRDKDGEAEVHENSTDVIVIESGEATLAMGGTLINPRTTAPGETRATSSAGGEKVPLAPGDIVRIPPHVAHQFLVAPGKTVKYFNLKVSTK
jgi:mannose-6-phosphate isomerase-like protein (cupin superfamily)